MYPCVVLPKDWHRNSCGFLIRRAPIAPPRPVRVSATTSSLLCLDQQPIQGWPLALGLLRHPNTRNGLPVGPLFLVGMGPFGGQRKIQMSSPFLGSGPPCWEPKTHESVSLRKIIQITQWVDQKCMSLETSSFKNVLITDTSKDMPFVSTCWAPSCLQGVFYTSAARSLKMCLGLGVRNSGFWDPLAHFGFKEPEILGRHE